jgi:hypothetical protein
VKKRGKANATEKGRAKKLIQEKCTEENRQREEIAARANKSLIQRI